MLSASVWESPLFRTALSCACAELLAFLLLLLVFESALSAVAVSLVILGPLSLWAAPALHSRFKALAARSNPSFQRTACGGR